MSAGGTKQMSEDIEVLRQILDNLIFSGEIKIMIYKTKQKLGS